MRSFCPLRGFGGRSGANRRSFWLSQKTVHAPASANKTVEIRVGSVETAVNRTFGGVRPSAAGSALARLLRPHFAPATWADDALHPFASVWRYELAAAVACGPACPSNDGRLHVVDRDSAQNKSHRAFLVMNPAEDRWFGVTAAPSPSSAFATDSRSNDGLAIALVAVASSLSILCMRPFRRSIARHAGYGDRVGRKKARVQDNRSAIRVLARA
jgi:hypothetical protein